MHPDHFVPSALNFGTGGIRGLMGEGRDRMNLNAVRQVTQGLINHIVQINAPRRVAIAYDSRLLSETFAREAACVLAANGFTALLYARPEPTPALSYAVRDLKCSAGVCITASHNPAQYNGYKVYGADGCQIAPEAARRIKAQIDAIRSAGALRLCAFSEALSAGGIRFIGDNTLKRYLVAVKAQRLRDVGEVPLRVVYTPLNGTGFECVDSVLRESGIRDLHVVREQKLPDGRFLSCPCPNPEAPEALSLGLRDAKACGAELLLATDPDCDRVGVAVLSEGSYVTMSGNEVGVLLLDYLCRSRLAQGTLPDRPVAVTTIVSSDMADAVAQKYGVELRRTLTGFKYIGEQIGLLEREGGAGRFVFGFEESCGFLSGSYVRDKDGVLGAMLLCEMARWYKKRGLSLLQAMRRLYENLGYYENRLHTLQFPGAQGGREISARMQRLREAKFDRIGRFRVLQKIDYAQGIGDLPASEVLELRLECRLKLIVRPSGTEPLLKIYTFARADSRSEAAQAEEELYRGFLSLCG